LEHFQDFGPKAEALRRVMTGLRRRGFNVVLLLMPEHSLLRSLVPPQAEVTFNQVLAEAAGNEPVPVISLRSAIPDEDFNSFVHVDRKGRKTVSEVLPGLLSQVEEHYSSEALAAEFRRPGVLITAPLENQVVQQGADDAAEIEVKGATLSDFDSAQIHWELPALGLASKEIDAAKVDSRTFAARIKLPRPGWYRLAVHVEREGRAPVTAVLARLGVGDVFVIGGGQRAANSARQRNRATRDVVAWRGGSWEVANDPQLLASGDGGSVWPAFGEAMSARNKLPIGLICLARKGTRGADWLPGTSLYAELKTALAAAAPSGVRAILWDCRGQAGDPQGSHPQGSDPGKSLDWFQVLVRQLRRETGCLAPCLIASDRDDASDASTATRIRPLDFRGGDGTAGCYALSRALPVPSYEKNAPQNPELFQAIAEAWADAASELPRSHEAKATATTPE
jgi:hypothetical protein